MFRKYLYYLGGFIAILVIVVVFCDLVVSFSTKDHLFDDVDLLPESEIGLLLGTTPQTRIGGKRNAFFAYRIDATKRLYDAGKIRKILISGDDHSLNGINESEVMRDSLVARGIPKDSILLDGRGYRTINSVINAKEIFGFDSFTLISQQFHNERALYQAMHLDINVGEIWGYNASSPHSALSALTYLREYLARVKMFIDLLNKEKYVKEATEDLDYYFQCNCAANLIKVELTIRPNEMDSVWLVPGQGYGYFRYDTLKSTFPDLSEICIYSLYGLPKLSNLGDIDGDGLDEIGFFSTAYDSNWNDYEVYSVKSGRWCSLVEKPKVFTAGYEKLCPQPHIVESLGNGYIKILRMSMQEDFIVGDTIILPNFRPLPDESDRAFADSLLAMIDNYYESSTEIMDSAMMQFLNTTRSFDMVLDCQNWHRLRVSTSEDNMARLITIPGRGTMTWGESYIQYRKDNGTIALKKIAYDEPNEDGGRSFPALFIELHNCKKGGYEAYGIFSFSSTEELLYDTLYVSQEFLESDQFIL